MIYLGTAQSHVNPKNWYGWSGPLSGTVPDILLGADILKDKVRKTFILRDEETTVEGYIQVFKEISAIMEDELLVWWDSGHGVEKLSQSSDEDTYFTPDQGIAAYDGIISDNQVAALLGTLTKGRVLFACDRCHSGSMYRAVKKTSKAVPKLITSNLTAYDYDKRNILFPTSTTLKVPLKYFGACQENQTAMDMGYNGKFTAEFWSCYKKNRNLPYISLYREMLGKFPATQTPKYVNRSSDKIFNTEVAFSRS